MSKSTVKKVGTVAIRNMIYKMVNREISPEEVINRIGSERFAIEVLRVISRMAWVGNGTAGDLATLSISVLDKKEL